MSDIEKITKNDELETNFISGNESIDQENSKSYFNGNESNIEPLNYDIASSKMPQNDNFKMSTESSGEEDGDKNEISKEVIYYEDGANNEPTFNPALKVSIYSPCESTNTSYQDLPSICSRNKSQAKFDELINQTDMELENEKDDKSMSTTTALALSSKATETYYNAKNLNASMQSTSTIDSLAKRVQSLVGPVDYRKTSMKHSLLDSARESTIDYGSVYKELEEIQSTLRTQRECKNEDFLENKENKKRLVYEKNVKLGEDGVKSQQQAQLSPYSTTATKVTPFSSNTNSMSSFENTSITSKFNFANKDLKKDEKKFCKDEYFTTALRSNLIRNETLNDLNFKSSILTKAEDLFLGQQQQTASQCSIQTMHSINSSLNPASTAISNENSNLKYSNSGESGKTKNYLTSSLTRVSNLTQMPPPAVRTPSKSAFENDPDIINFNRANSGSNFLNRNENLYKNHYSYKNEKSSGVNEEGYSASSRVAANLKPKYLHRNTFSTESNSETIESTHTDSDDARGPVFSPDVYGSRPTSHFNYNSHNIHLQKSRTSYGIYDKRDLNNKISRHYDLPEKKTYSANNLVDSNKRDDEGFDERGENLLLDSDYLKAMDKKLKKLIRKNVSRDLACEGKMKVNGGSKSGATIAWEISPSKKKDDELKQRNNESLNSNDSNNTQSVQSNVIASHPYLPLRDVPMHDLVKKLQREFELDGEVNNLPADMNSLWMNVKSHLNSEQNNKKKNAKKSEPDNSESKENLQKLIQNPIKSLIDNNCQTEIEEKIVPNDEVQQKIKNESMKKKSFLFEPGLKLDDFKNLSKDELKTAILKQKDQHEFRVKALEKLARLERLQAEKLKKIIQISQDESITSLIYDTLIQTNLDENETTFDLDTLEALEKEIFNENRLFKSKCDVKKADDLNDEETCNDEENTIMSDTENNNNNNNNNNFDCVPVINELNNEKRGFFFTADETPKKAVCNTKSEPSVLRNKPVDKAISWSYSFTNFDRDENEFNFRPANVSNIRDLNPSKKFQFELANKAEDEKKLSLQEAFEIYKYDLISKSRKRQREIELRAQQRRKDNEYRADQLSDLEKNFKNNFRLGRSLKQAKESCFEVNVENFMHNRRQMTSKEIKSQTKKMYQKLPEVQQKQLKQKTEENKKRNRIKSMIYKKTIQQRVLSRGPNFNLNFKALENSIQ